MKKKQRNNLIIDPIQKIPFSLITELYGIILILILCLNVDYTNILSILYIFLQYYILFFFNCVTTEYSQKMQQHLMTTTTESSKSQRK